MQPLHARAGARLPLANAEKRRGSRQRSRGSIWQLPLHAVKPNSRHLLPNELRVPKPELSRTIRAKAAGKRGTPSRWAEAQAGVRGPSRMNAEQAHTRAVRTA